MLIVGCGLPSVKLGTPTNFLQHNNFSELDSLMSKEQRPIAVFLHANWCKYCLNMEQTTFQNESVVDLLNGKYYFISFDGEQKAEVVLHDHRFDYVPTGRNSGTHQLATALGTIDGTLAYPVFVILNSEYEIVFQYSGFLGAGVLTAILERGEG